MKVLLINKLVFPNDGAAISTINTGKLLEKHGHDVAYWGMSHPNNPVYSTDKYFVDNIDYHNVSGIKTQIKYAQNLLYSFEAKNKLTQLLKVYKPDIVHLNNFAHQLSPSILHVFKHHKIPCVMTMRDYKMVCPVYTMMKNGKPCELCKNGQYYNCTLHKCAKDSRSKSILNTFEMYLHHNILQIYDYIKLYIAPSKFLAEKCKEMGLRSRIEYLSNFIFTDEYKPQYGYKEESIVYVGRLSHEKGIDTLISSVKDLPITLKIIGDGPLRNQIEKQTTQLSNVRMLGFRSGIKLQNEIQKSMCVVVPSEWYENNPRSILESFSLGKPVIGANIGGIPELIDDKNTGWLFEPGNTTDLRNRINSILHSRDNLSAMGKKCRLFSENKFGAETHYEALLDIYNEAIRS